LLGSSDFLEDAKEGGLFDALGDAGLLEEGTLFQELQLGLETADMGLQGGHVSLIVFVQDDLVAVERFSSATKITEKTEEKCDKPCS